MLQKSKIRLKRELTLENIFEQIKSFLLQLLQQRIKFTPYGLFDIDLGLFCMVRRIPADKISWIYSFFFIISKDNRGRGDLHFDSHSIWYRAENINHLKREVLETQLGSFS